MSSDQLDQIYMSIIDSDAMSKLPLVDFQNQAANPASDGSWLMKEPFREDGILKLAGAMEEVLPPEQRTEENLRLLDEVNEMTREERQEFMKNATFGENQPQKNPGGPEV